MAYAEQRIQVTLEETTLEEAAFALAHVKNGVQRATRGAIDKALRAGRRQVIADLPQYVNYAKNRLPKRVRMLPYKPDKAYGQLRVYGGPMSLTYVSGREYVPVRQGMRVPFFPGQPVYFIPYSKLVFIGRTGKRPIIAVGKQFRNTFPDWPKLAFVAQRSGIAERARVTMGEVANAELGNQIEKLLAKHGTAQA